MNINTIKAILNKADPLNNPNYQERQVALNMAHKAMGRDISYASLGYSLADAERIENQFAVTSGHTGNAGSSHTGYQWWNPFSWGESQAEPKYKPHNDYERETADRGEERTYTWMPPQVIIEGYGDERATDGSC